MYFKCCSLTFCCTINIISFRLCHVNKLCGLCLVFAKVKASCAPSRWAYLLWLVRSDDASVVWKLRAVRRWGWWFGNWSNNPIGSDVSWWILLAKPCWWRVDVEDYEVCMFHTIQQAHEQVVVGPFTREDILIYLKHIWHVCFLWTHDEFDFVS